MSEPPSPITAAIDYPPNIKLSNYNNVSTNDNLLPIMDPPKPRPTITNLAIIFPESKEFSEITPGGNSFPMYCLLVGPDHRWPIILI